MRLELGAPVVLRRDGDQLVVDVVHLPAPEKVVRCGPGLSVLRAYPLADVADMPGLRLWPTVCGVDGWIYVYGGPIRDAVADPHSRIRICAGCIGSRRAPLPRPDLVARALGIAA